MKDNDDVVGSTSTKIINNTVVAVADHKVSSTTIKSLKDQHPQESRVRAATTLMSKSKESYFLDSQEKKVCASDVALAASNGKRKHPRVDLGNGFDGKLKKDGAETE
ncbi:hypothetical protein A2U01_0060934, partial [Trifolium medium]|nr:hypothetical protein [Trifolium medium]